MAILSFTLGPEAVGKLHDALACLGKFNESVSLEASGDHLVLTALNSTKTGYASFTFSRNKFFSRYSYNPPRIAGKTKEKFTCRIYNKALASIFKGRAADPAREKDTGIEKCDVSIEDEAGKTRSRFVVQMSCRHGVLKTYQLTFESASSMHALFKPEMTRSAWSISSRVLREFAEHFGPKTEQLDIFSKDGRVTFTSYTEKIMAGKEVLKQPLHTSIAIDTTEFSRFDIEEMQHIIISVKDFRAIVAHAGIVDTEVSAAYSYPSKPMQLKYSDEGVQSEFILMTMGEHRAASATPAPNETRSSSARAASRQQLEAASSVTPAQSAASMPPPSRQVMPVRQESRAREPRPSPPPQPMFDSNSLFVSQDDGDSGWDPKTGFDDEDEEMFMWDASANIDDHSRPHGLTRNNSTAQNINGSTDRRRNGSPQRIDPTQRMSQIRGLFDDDDD